MNDQDRAAIEKFSLYAPPSSFADLPAPDEDRLVDAPVPSFLVPVRVLTVDQRHFLAWDLRRVPGSTFFNSIFNDVWFDDAGPATVSRAWQPMTNPCRDELCHSTGSSMRRELSSTSMRRELSSNSLAAEHPSRPPPIAPRMSLDGDVPMASPFVMVERIDAADEAMSTRQLRSWTVGQYFAGCSLFPHHFGMFRPDGYDDCGDYDAPDDEVVAINEGADADDGGAGEREDETFDDCAFAVTEAISLRLELVLESKLRFKHEHVTFFLWRLLRGLATLHEHGLVVGDLTAVNCLTRQDWAVKLDLDGVWRIPSFDEVQEGSPPTASTCDVSQLEYLSPERLVVHQRRSPASDIWAAGAILFRMVCRRGLFGDVAGSSVHIPGDENPSATPFHSALQTTQRAQLHLVGSDVRATEMEEVFGRLAASEAVVMDAILGALAPPDGADVNVVSSLPELLEQESKIGPVSPGIVDAIGRMLRYVPSQRASAAELLRSPLFDDLRGTDTTTDRTEFFTKDPWELREGLREVSVDALVADTKARMTHARETSSAKLGALIQAAGAEPLGSTHGQPHLVPMDVIGEVMEFVGV